MSNMNRNYTNFLISALLVVAFLVTSVGVTYGQNQKKEQEEIFLGLSAHAVRSSWEDLYVKAFNWYASDISMQREDLDIRTTWTQAGYDSSTQITQAKRLIDMGVDGLIISPWNAEALTTVTEYAREHDVPVIATNTAVNSSYPLMNVSYGAFRGTKQLGDRIANYLKNQVEPVGKVKGTVLEVSAELGTSEASIRGGGFHAAIDKYEEVDVITQVVSGRQEALTKTLNTLRSGKEFNAVFTHDGAMAMGATKALKNYGDANPKNTFIAAVDAFPDVLKEIGKGNIDVAIDQPPAFYNPIAVHYMIKYLREGEEAIPDYGETITKEELTIKTGKKHLGVDPWAAPVWAPAKIEHMTEYGEAITEDHKWFQTSAVFVTKENYDSPILWGNFPLPGW